MKIDDLTIVSAKKMSKHTSSATDKVFVIDLIMTGLRHIVEIFTKLI